MFSENGLHSKVVYYIRKFHPHAKMVDGFGNFKASVLRESRVSRKVEWVLLAKEIWFFGGNAR